MSGKPAARQSDPTSCPVPGHGTNPIATGSPNVLFDNLPAARLSDTSACGSPIAGAVASTVLINGLPAATLGSTGGHGSVIIGGSGTVIIGDSVVTAPFVSPAPLDIGKWISFQIPTAERYTGWQCIAYFDDGSTLTGTFNNDNLVTFTNASGSICTRVEIPLPSVSEQPSVTDKLLSMITGNSQG
jgi:uncharacterized Zn-binding protein involved in type VI secretion